MIIRSEQASDIPVIHQLTADAFAPKAFSDGTEPDVIDELRRLGDLTHSLVAVDAGKVLGHVAFSPIKVGSETVGWYGLGPIAVWPSLQRTGIGSALINEGLSQIRKNGAKGCALIGDPAYYCRFGFVADNSVHYANVPDRNVQWLAFDNKQPSGLLVFSTAFGD